MDELTLNGEKYISSKRAAKITGYTKDYVGQLCREGKIIAQLVGRNWYVSEESMHKHRFEFEDKSSQVPATPKHLTHSTSTVHHTLQDSVHYSYDDANIIPLQKKEQVVAQIPKIETPQEVQQEVQSQKKSDMKSDVLSTMQNAWQEWFTTATHAITRQDNSYTEHYAKEADDSVDVSEIQSEENGEAVHLQDYAVQPVSVHKMSPIHLTHENRAIKESMDTDTEPKKYFSHKISKVAHMVNIFSMLLALVFFVVALLNIFLSTHTTINQLHYITGVSVYTAK
ncbi:MAG TPA: DNA-binding protein [Candidatus Kaiserbacteria bacterium]|nr:DNA-binding protein [Candidatus Kaiserbacteria bacterium]